MKKFCVSKISGIFHPPLNPSRQGRESPLAPCGRGVFSCQRNVKMGIDERNIEIIDDIMARIFREKTPLWRVQVCNLNPKF